METNTKANLTLVLFHRSAFQQIWLHTHTSRSLFVLAFFDTDWFWCFGRLYLLDPIYSIIYLAVSNKNAYLHHVRLHRQRKNWNVFRLYRLEAISQASSMSTSIPPYFPVFSRAECSCLGQKQNIQDCRLGFCTTSMRWICDRLKLA